MTLGQIARVLQDKLRQRKWKGNPANAPLFHSLSVIVTVTPEREAIQDAVQPVCLVVPEEGQADPEGGGEQSDYFRGTIRLVLFTMVEGDALGERALLGANRDSDGPIGHGILELVPEVLAVTKRLLPDDGVILSLHSQGAARGQAVHTDQGLWYLVAQENTFTVTYTAEEYYPPARRMAATVAGPVVSLSWLLPPDRFDTYRPILVRKAGSTPPTSVTDGTPTTLADGASATTDSPGSGTWSYAIFIAYDPNGETPTGSGDLTYSAGATVAGVAV